MDNFALVPRKAEKEDKLLENKSKRDKRYKRKWKPYKNLSYAEKKYLADKESFKDNFKRELNNNPNILKNLDFSRKHINLVSKPETPHNTTQYLSSNFSQGRNENVPTVVSCFSPVYNEEIPNDWEELGDDYCVPGGSMRDLLINQIDELPKKADEADINKYKSIIEHQKKIITMLTEKLNNAEAEGFKHTGGDDFT